jgi:hypothetical protein
MPYIIVTLGPTGAGKSTLIGKTIRHLGLEERYTKILIDDLVENNPTYKKYVADIIRDVEKECRLNNEICDTRKYYLNPSEQLLEKFNKAYFTVRKADNCIKESPLSCDSLNDARLKQAIEDESNIVFETTGAYIPSWLLSDPFINSKYRVIFAYSLVSFDNLIQRNQSRVIKSIKEFQRDNSNPGPRLPNIERRAFLLLVSTIRDTLLNIYESCIIKRNLAKCGTKEINQLLLFDNNPVDMQLAFDSIRNKLSVAEFTRVVNDAFDL